MTAQPDAPARRSSRRLIRATLVAGLVLLLSGCLKYDLRVLVNEDDTMDGVLIFAVARDFALGSDIFAQSVELTPSSGSIARERYEDEDYVGTKYTLTGVPISELNVLSSDASTDYSLTRQGDEFVLDARLSFNIGSQDVPAATTNFTALIAFTFPGEVLESNGSMDGNTVTWADLRADAANELTARASAIENGAAGDTGGGLPWWAWVAGGVVLLAAIGAVVALLLRRRRSAAAGPVPPAGVDQYGSPVPPNAYGYPHTDPAYGSYQSTPYQSTPYQSAPYDGSPYDSSPYDSSPYDSGYDYLYAPQTDVTPVEEPGQYSGETVLSRPASGPPPGQDQQRPPD